MGRTELPMEVIEEYLDSLANVYTAEVRPTLPFLTRADADSLPVLRSLHEQLQQLLPGSVYVSRWQGNSRAHPVAAPEGSRHAVWPDAAAAA